MVTFIRTAMAFSLLAGCAAPAAAQFGLLEQGAKRAKQVSDFSWSDQEKAALGSKVSELVRQRYGVVQDAAVHKYVTLVGRAVAEKSSKPNLPWTFIVLDTDAVNAFAAPHGYVHVTRGALALMKDESELAGVLAHEIVHVSEEHTVDALKKNTLKSAAAEQVAGGNALIEFLANAAYNNILDNAYSRGDEGAADTLGIALISKTGYAPQGLGSFLTTLADRNKSATEKRGLFNSHPEMQARQDKLCLGHRQGQVDGDAAGGRTVQGDDQVQAGAAVADCHRRGRHEGPGRRVEQQGQQGRSQGGSSCRGSQEEGLRAGPSRLRRWQRDQVRPGRRLWRGSRARPREGRQGWRQPRSGGRQDRPGRPAGVQDGWVADVGVELAPGSPHDVNSEQRMIERCRASVVASMTRADLT